tara:strand:+ start:1684 stop:2214 length:531 start_codon:yes stop_codon:yes gene_type:complete
LLSSLAKVDMNKAEEQVPNTKGLYLWKNKKNQKYEYIGIATNKDGLKGRIVSKHLKEDYLEGREKKHSLTKDRFQLENPIFKKNRPNKKFIDKSAFRKNVGRLLELCPGKETLAYIRNYGTFYFYSFEEIEDEHLEAVETILIASLQPKFNISKKNVPIIYSDKLSDNFHEIKLKV